MTVEELKVHQLMLDGGTQARAKLDFRYIAKLVNDIKKGKEIEPVVVFFDGSKYWLADGFHRARAITDAGLKVMRAVIKRGDRRAALLFGLIAAADAEAHRTRLDKRRAVTLLLTDSEWSNWSNQEIADRLKVSLPFVSSLRKSLAGSKANKSKDEGSLGIGQSRLSPEDISNHIHQENLLAFDTDLEDGKEGVEISDNDIASLPSSERCILIDPYLASPEVIAKVIEELKAHYHRKTGREYRSQ